MNRNLILLIIIQTLFLVGNMMFITITPILGKELAGSMSLATLPIAVSMITMLIFSFPLSIYMGRLGRGPVFAFGLIANLLAGLIFFSAVQLHLFSLFILGSVFFGLSIACANFYRFSAMELVDKREQPLAISAVMAAGVIAALIGPNLSALTKDLVFDQAFSGSVLAYVPISVIALILLFYIKWPKLTNSGHLVNSPINIKDQIWKPMFTAAVTYGVMILIMSATPLHMSNHHHDYSDTAWVIQWHLIGMFAPSFFISYLVKQLGLRGLLLLGLCVLTSSLLVNLSAQSKLQLTIGLLLLGIGWNFLFIGASQWLMKLSQNRNSSKVQGINEVMVFGLASIATLSSGWLLQEFGWVKLNLAALPLLGLLFVVLLQDKQVRQTVF